MLLEKEAQEKAYASGAIDKEKYEAAIDEIEKKYRETRSSLSDDYRLQELLEEKAHAGQAEKITAEKTAALTSLETNHNAELEGVNTARNTMVEDLTAKQNAEVDALNKARRLETVTIENDVNAMLTYLNNQRNTMVAQMRAQEQAIETEHLRRMKELIEQGQQQQNDIIRVLLSSETTNNR